MSDKNYKISVTKDGDGYLAKVVDCDNLYAFAYTKQDAVKELFGVVEMTMDYHLEQIETERQIKNTLLRSNLLHAL